MTPDASGTFKGVRVPTVPWHDEAQKGHGMAYHEQIAKIKRTTLGYEGHGIFTCVLHLDYGSSGQGAGTYALDTYDEETKQRRGTAFGMDWIIRAMRACGVDEWSKVAGRTVIALTEGDSWSSPVVGIKPLPTEPGAPFMFRELADEHFPEKVASHA